MLREPLKVEAYTIKEVQGLDPIYVYWEDFSLGKGRVTITCYGEAWTAYWGAMGNRTIRKFFADCDNGYLFNNLGLKQFLKKHKGHETYLRRIIDVVKADLARE